MIDVERAIFDLQARCNRIEQILKQLDVHIQSLCKTALHLDEVEATLCDFKNGFDGMLDAEKKNLQEYIADVANTLKENDKDIKHLDIYSHSLGHAIYDIKDEIQRCKEKDEIICSQINANLATLREDLRRETKEKINAIPSPKIPTEQEIDARIDFKTEAIRLDARNGVLRSAFCEQKIAIMEKKIDQLFLILQKHSLTP
jgi:chromosome segregation ATPase